MKDGSQAQMLVSFHCIGRPVSRRSGLLGNMVRRLPTDDGGSETEGRSALSDEVFQINYKEPWADLELRFKDWLESAVERGLALWENAAL